MADSSSRNQTLVGLLLFLVSFLLIALLIGTWPNYETDGTLGRSTAWILGRALGANLEIRLLFIVALAGALGSSIQAAKSFSSHVGRNEFQDNWIAWYFLRFPVGIGLALLTYLVIRGGFLTGSFSADTVVAKNINPFGIAAVAALTGMFAREASNKLSEIFLNLFRTEENNGGASPAPTIESVPNVTRSASGADLDIQITGKNFRSGLTAYVNDVERKVVGAVSATSVKVRLDAKDASKAGDQTLKIQNPGGKSDEKKLTIVVPGARSVPSSAPAISSASVALDAAGGGKATLTGTNFATGAKLLVGGKEFTATIIGTTDLSADLPAADVGGAKKLKLKVRNPNGETSAEVEAKVT